MTLSSTQCFFVLLIVAAARGYARGWHREIITTAITLGSVLFLTIGGGDALAQLLTVGVPDFFRGVNPHLDFTNAAPNPLVDGITLLAFTVLGHFAGTHYGTAPKSAQHRLAGTVAGAVTGLALTYYITRQLLPVTTFGVTSPSTTLVTTWIIGLFGVGLMVLLFMALVRK
ncbi:MAG TPA: hypothetical protein VF812_04790 [Ktedonobacterales bacterium]